jgi:hypothetical protein
MEMILKRQQKLLAFLFLFNSPAKLHLLMRHFILFSFILIFAACGQSEADYKKPETDLQAATDFIRFSLNGNFKFARYLLVNDSTNDNYMKMVEEKYKQSSLNKRDSMRNSNINIHEVAVVAKDSLSIVNYSNSYSNKPFKVKVLKQNGDWLIDLKYTFSGNL